jgi:hypothetical protein
MPKISEGESPCIRKMGIGKGSACEGGWSCEAKIDCDEVLYKKNSLTMFERGTLGLRSEI